MKEQEKDNHYKNMILEYPHPWKKEKGRKKKVWSFTSKSSDLSCSIYNSVLLYTAAKIPLLVYQLNWKVNVKEIKTGKKQEIQGKKQ